MRKRNCLPRYEETAYASWGNLLLLGLLVLIAALRFIPAELAEQRATRMNDERAANAVDRRLGQRVRLAGWKSA